MTLVATYGKELSNVTGGSAVRLAETLPKEGARQWVVWAEATPIDAESCDIVVTWGSGGAKHQQRIACPAVGLCYAFACQTLTVDIQATRIPASQTLPWARASVAPGAPNRVWAGSGLVPLTAGLTGVNVPIPAFATRVSFSEDSAGCSYQWLDANQASISTAFAPINNDAPQLIPVNAAYVQLQNLDLVAHELTIGFEVPS